MHALLIPIFGLAGTVGVISLALLFVTRSRHALLSGGTFPQLPAPPPQQQTTLAATEFEQRLERNGVTICDFATFGGFLLVDSRLLPVGPAVPRLQELHARNASGHTDRCLAFPMYKCAYCPRRSYLVIQLVPTNGDFEIRTCFKCCPDCGKIYVSPNDLVPSRFVGVENILEWLDVQDRSEAVNEKIERLKQLHDEHEQLRSKLAANELETMRLDYELNPRTERDAYRDRHLLPDAGAPEDKSP